MKILFNGVFLYISLVMLPLVMSSTVQAQVEGDVSALLKSVQVDKTQIKAMLDMMEQSGQISKEMADQARSELNKKSDSEIQALQEMAIKKIEKGEVNLPSNLNINSAPVEPAALPKKVVPTATPAANPAAVESKTDSELKSALQFLNAK